MDAGASCDGLWLGGTINRGVQQELANMPTRESMLLHKTVEKDLQCAVMSDGDWRLDGFQD